MTNRTPNHKSSELAQFTDAMRRILAVKPSQLKQEAEKKKHSASAKSRKKPKF